MLVKDLTERLSQRREQAITVSVTDLTIDDLAANLTVESTALGTKTYPIDEVAEKALAKFLDIPAGYVKSCPSLFKAQTLNFWLDEYSEHDVTLHTLNDMVVAANGTDVKTVPTVMMGKVIASVFDSDDRVEFYRGIDSVQFDVISEAHQIEVPNPLNIPFRPEVGDITKGGVRFYLYPYQLKPPSAVPYFERLTCTNGMCTEQKLGNITIKGNTVPEILEEIETKARYLMDVVDMGLANYAATAAKRIPGSLQAFVYQLGKEYKLGKQVMDEVMSIINQLPEDQVTVYDVNQAFTQVANRGVTGGVRQTLQTLGGALALQADKMIRRCGQCERLL